MLDGLSFGVGFFIALFVLAAFREILGSGSFAGIPLFAYSFQPLPFFSLPAGGFLLLGILLACFGTIKSKIIEKRSLV